MKTTFTTFKTLVFTITLLFGFQASFGQDFDQVQNEQLVKYKSKPIVKNTTILSDTFDYEVSGIIAPNYSTPISQVECINFASEIYDCPDTANISYNVDLSIIDNNGNEVYYDSINTVSDCGTGIQLFDCFTPTEVITSYTGYYSLSSNGVDPNLGNNFDTIQFEISEKTYAKENGGTQTIIPAESNWDPNEPHSWAFGNFYHVVNGGPDDVWPSVRAETFGFSIGNASDPGIAGKLITIYLYKWTEDSNEDGNMDPDERIAVAFNVYEINGTEQEDDIIIIPTYSFPTANEGPVELESNQNYVLMLEYATPDQIDLELVASTEFNYEPMRILSEILGTPRYGAMLGIGSDLGSKSYGSIGFGEDVVPVLRLNPIEIIDPTKNLLAIDSKLSLSPNPTNSILNVEINLFETQKEATIKIYDLNGRVLKQESYKNIKYEKINFDLTKFVDGAYFLQFVSDTGVRTKRFIVQHD